jgi:hypothetical protein
MIIAFFDQNQNHKLVLLDVPGNSEISDKHLLSFEPEWSAQVKPCEANNKHDQINKTAHQVAIILEL